MEHTFVKQNTALADSAIHYSDAVDLSAYGAFAYDVDIRARTSGGITVTFQRAVKSDGEFTDIETGASAVTAVGHNHGTVNSRVNAGDVLGWIRCKVDLNTDSGVGVSMDVSIKTN